MPNLIRNKIMQPSEKKRKFYLLLSSKNVIQKPFMYCGLIIMLVSVILILLFGKTNLPVHSTVNGVSKIEYVSGTIIYLFIFLFGLLFYCIGKFFVEFIYRFVNKNRDVYPVNDIKLSKDYLLQDVLTLPESNPDLDIVVNGDWIDVTWNVFNESFINLQSISKSQTIYYKLVLIHDDYTYEDLDYEVTGDIDLSLRHLSLHKSMRCGHFSHKAYYYNFNGESFGYDSNTINNIIDEYLASKGYTRLCK